MNVNSQFDGWAGIKVLTRPEWKKPLPVIFVTWGDQCSFNYHGENHDIMVPTDRLFGPSLFQSLKMLLKPERRKRTRWHRFDDHPLWETQHVFCRFMYRDSPTGESLAMNLESPMYFTLIAMQSPKAKAVLDQHAKDPTRTILLERATLPDADQNWFEWKAAYQDVGYYAVIYGDLLNRHAISQAAPGHGDWVERTDIPGFLCTTLDFSEVGPYEKILTETTAARAKLRGM